MILLLELLELLLPPLDLVLEFRERRGVFLTALDVLRQPARVGLVLREGGDEVLARHAGIAHRDDHDLLLELAHLRHMGAQVEYERIKHARGELQLHELVRELLAGLERLRVARAVLVHRGERVRVRLGDRGEARGGLCRIRAGVDGLLLALGTFLTFLLVVGLLIGLDQLQLGGVLRLGDDVGGVRVDEADDHVDETRLSCLHRLVGPQKEVIRRWIHRERAAHRIETFLDALGNPDLSLARQQLDGPHLAHVHANGVRRAAQLRIERRQRGRRLLDRLLIRGCGRLGGEQRLGVRRLLVHRNAHVVDGVDDVLDLLGIDDLGGQVVVHLRVGEVTLLLAARDEQLELGLAILRHHRDATLDTERFSVRSILRAYALGVSGACAFVLRMPFVLCMRGVCRFLRPLLRGGRLVGAVLVANRAHGYRFLGGGHLDGLGRLRGRTFLTGGKGLVLACHDSGWRWELVPLCAARIGPTQGAPKQSGQFYLTSA